jgi:hypothetical protein
VRQPLAMGLFNTLVNAKREDELIRCDALLDELRALESAHLDDAAVRELSLDGERLLIFAPPLGSPLS